MENPNWTTIELNEGERVDDLERCGFKIIQNTERFCFGMDAVLLSGYAFAKRGEKVLDLCTGSGCIARAVSALTDAAVSASDVSPEALSLAIVNCGSAVRFYSADLFDLADGGTLGRFDAILSNPPYIPTERIAELQAEVRGFEPRLALDGGADGLDIIRRMISEAPRHLNPGGFLLVEIGFDQGPAAAAMAEAAGLSDVHIIKDLSGLDRILSAVKKKADIFEED